MKKVVKRTLSMTMAAAMTLGLMVGCSSAKGEQKSESTAPQSDQKKEASGQPVTIKFWDGNWQEAVWPEVEAIWNKEHPDIKIEAEFQADLANDKYMLALKNGTAPDVLSCALDWVTTFGNAGLLAPLNDYVAKDSLDVNQFVKGANDASTVGGKLYGLPFRSETYVMFYNKDILSTAGYNTPPATWDEVKKAAAACTNGDVYGYGLCGTNYSNFSFQYITMLRSSGGDILNADNRASALGSDVAIQTAQLYKDLAAYAPVSLLENDNIANRTLFASGKIAMYLSGIYDLAEIVKANPDLNFACTMVPTANGAERNTILGGWSVAVAESSKEKEAAWEFVKFLSRPDIAAIYTNTFTGTAEVAARYTDYPEEIIKPNADALQYANALPAVENIVGIRQAIMDNLQLMLSEDMSAEEASGLLDQATTKLLE
ncbi:MAG TPA: sugar ABC transporter substrate-binding protein [Lachnoclostridium sp.]|jgi:multiple sugar transport system substrate-binding protein|uniref:ABC transporter substrate-binding protein n=1 Tax=Lacrimispora sp. TaxID=2719234 RepID=UPI000EE5B265|nr:sugar ABC transporter substrate-binding protein [Lacrimispora sp.]HCD42468.1 sugar ABC transporter substrate-binding protein [Lachnoclostridium sp.]